MMAGAEERAIRKLEQQIAKTQQRLDKTRGRQRRRGGLVGGLLLGTVAGGLLTYALIRRNGEEDWEEQGADDAILLREQPTPTGQTAEVKPLPKLNVAEEQDNATVVAETTLESPGAAREIEAQTENNTRPASLAQPTTAQAAPAQQAAASSPPAPPTKAEEPAKVDQPATRAEQLAATPEQPISPQQARTQEAPLPVETERPEIVVAKTSGNSEATLAEATSDEPTPPPNEGSAEPVDGVCPASHPIKGNRGSMGAMIYHVPGGRNYERTKPEACFATIEEAEAAGYRAPRG